MNKLMKNKFRMLALLILVLVLGAATYGFAAGNTINDAGLAGEGSGDVSGYTVTSVNYTLNSGDPTDFDTVTFTLDAAAGDVYAGPGDGTSVSWSTSSCNDLGSNRFECDISGSSISVANATKLHVSSVQ